MCEHTNMDVDAASYKSAHMDVDAASYKSAHEAAVLQNEEGVVSTMKGFHHQTSV